MTPELASFVGYLRVLNGEIDLAVPTLRYAQRSGISDEPLLMNLAFCLAKGGELDEASAILEEVRQRYGDREKANLLLVKVLHNRDAVDGGISLEKANELIEAVPESGNRYRLQSQIYLKEGIMARGNATLSRQYFAKSAELMVEACRRGEDLRHWNNMRNLLPDEIRELHSKFFRKSGTEPAYPDNRDFTIDPLSGYQLPEIIKLAADQVQQPIVVAGR